MKLWRWEPGRGHTGYSKFLLAAGKIGGVGVDAYIIDFPVGSYVKQHTDPIPGAQHYRLNIFVWGPPTIPGGLSKTKLCSRAYIFRPDVLLHQLLPSDKRRILLSFGLALENKRWPGR